MDGRAFHYEDFKAWNFRVWGEWAGGLFFRQEWLAEGSTK